jgi:hypothetical protein
MATSNSALSGSDRHDFAASQGLDIASLRSRLSHDHIDLALTAVHEQSTAGDATAFVRGEERDRFGDLIRGCCSVQRNGRNDGLDAIVLLPFRYLKACVTGRRRNDARTDRAGAVLLARPLKLLKYP